MPVTITTRIDDSLSKLIDDIAKREGMDRSTVLRRFLMEASKNWLINKALKDFEEGKVTLRQAADFCNLPLRLIIEEISLRKVKIPYTLEDLNEDIKGLDE
ncbi:MAG: UPF0175 family protein [Candidatus Humimicrobiaceae bacterium]